MKAQLEGAATIVIGLLFAMLPLRPSAWKWPTTAALALLAYGLVIASLLN